MNQSSNPYSVETQCFQSNKNSPHHTNSQNVINLHNYSTQFNSILNKNLLDKLVILQTIDIWHQLNALLSWILFWITDCVFLSFFLSFLAAPETSRDSQTRDGTRIRAATPTEPRQWQDRILNPLCPKRTLGISFSSLRPPHSAKVCMFIAIRREIKK